MNLKLLLFLCLLYILAVWRANTTGFVVNEIARFTGAIVGFGFPHFIGLIVWKNKPRLENIFITVLLLLLLASPQTSLLLMFILGLITALIKTVLRLNNQPIFNPAAAGLFAGSFLGITTTWWGVSFSPRLPLFNMSFAMLLTLPVGLYFVKIYQRLPTLISLPLSYFVVYFLLTGTLPLVTIFEGTFAFFLLVMAIEPKTTPVIDRQEWLYGPLVGISLAALSVFHLIGAPYLVVLLAANLIFSLYRYSTTLVDPLKK